MLRPKPVCGEDNWKEWCELLDKKSLLDRVVYSQCHRRFRFGNSGVLASKRCVTFPIFVFGIEREMTVWLVPGSTPRLIARPSFEDWGAVVDFRNSRWLSLDSDTREWTQIPRDEKGHLVIDVLGGFPSREGEQVYKEEEEHEAGPKQEAVESDSSTGKDSFVR